MGEICFKFSLFLYFEFSYIIHIFSLVKISTQKEKDQKRHKQQKKILKHILKYLII